MPQKESVCHCRFLWNPAGSSKNRRRNLFDRSPEHCPVAICAGGPIRTDPEILTRPTKNRGRCTLPLTNMEVQSSLSSWKGGLCTPMLAGGRVPNSRHRNVRKSHPFHPASRCFSSSSESRLRHGQRSKAPFGPTLRNKWELDRFMFCQLGKMETPNQSRQLERRFT